MELRNWRISDLIMGTSIAPIYLSEISTKVAKMQWRKARIVESTSG